MKDYHINIFHSEEDDGYTADILDLEGCPAFGDTPEEALLEVRRTRVTWLQVARESGKDVPLPRYRPAIYQAAG